MLESIAEQLIFIDESLFKLQSGWHSMIYVPIGAPTHYYDDMTRGNIWSILPAYTVNGYLLCTDIKKSFYNSDQFYIWIVNSLFPHLNFYLMHQSIVCLDNLSIHLDPWVWQAIEDHGCLLKFLPPYSPDYSSIELSFDLLKAWFQCHLRAIHPLFQGNFRGLLEHAIQASECDSKATEHFQHSVGGYMFEDDLEAYMHTLADV